MRHRILSALAAVMTACTMGMAQPRIVNIVNFVRQNDYREENSEEKLLEATRKELELVNTYKLKATFLLQYDALVDPRYKELFGRKDKRIEIGAWWEITKPHVEDAGLSWRGDHPWVSAAHIAFTTGYTQQERKRLVDIYMSRFKKTFGKYPKSVGSWYIDAWTLEYMQKEYGIVASCNCKDQIGTDGYTLWGGYWNQAYYPSRVNGYMPAQTREGQISVPVFRMLGSDPIYQYDSGLGSNGQGVITLEPVYAHAGGNRQWTERFLDAITRQPCLAFGYTQAGQENSFTWPSIREGLLMQIPLISALETMGKIQVQTLEESGRWFRKHFKTTPATAVTALVDTQDKGRKTLWYDSRFYRANLLVDADGSIRFRDIHLFDERLKSDYYDRPGTSSHFVFETLPLVDGFKWSTREHLAGLRLVKVTGTQAENIRVSDVQVIENDQNTLTLKCMDPEGSPFLFTFDPEGFHVTAPRATCQWALEFTAATPDLPFTEISSTQVKARYLQMPYTVKALRGTIRQGGAGDSWLCRLLPQQGMIHIDCSVR